MRHAQTGRKLGVSSPHRIALLRSLTLAIIEHDAIKTTPARAKELRWYAERAVTLAKRGDVHSRRVLVRLLGSTQTNKPGENRVRNAVDRVFTVLAPRFKERPGGYTQILKLALPRPGDCAEMCIIRYIPDEDKKAKGAKDKTPKKPTPKAKAAASDKPAKAAAPKADKAEKKSAEPQDKPAKAKAKKKD